MSLQSELKSRSCSTRDLQSLSPLSTCSLLVKLRDRTRMPPLLFGKVHVRVHTSAHTYLEGCFGGRAWLTWPSSPDSSEAHRRLIQ